MLVKLEGLDIKTSLIAGIRKLEFAADPVARREVAVDEVEMCLKAIKTPSYDVKILPQSVVATLPRGIDVLIKRLHPGGSLPYIANCVAASTMRCEDVSAAVKEKCSTCDCLILQCTCALLDELVPRPKCRIRLEYVQLVLNQLGEVPKRVFLVVDGSGTFVSLVFLLDDGRYLCLCPKFVSVGCPVHALLLAQTTFQRNRSACLGFTSGQVRKRWRTRFPSFPTFPRSTSFAIPINCNVLLPIKQPIGK
jgi:hypothetical protein